MSRKYEFILDAISHGLENDYFDEFLVVFTISEGRPRGLNRPAEPAGVDIVEIFGLEGEDRVEIDDDLSNDVLEYLEDLEDEMLQSANEDDLDLLEDQADLMREYSMEEG